MPVYLYTTFDLKVNIKINYHKYYYLKINDFIFIGKEKKRKKNIKTIQIYLAIQNIKVYILHIHHNMMYYFCSIYVFYF